VSAVVYFILQHLPLLPADAQSLAARRRRPAFGPTPSPAPTPTPTPLSPTRGAPSGGFVGRSGGASAPGSPKRASRPASRAGGFSGGGGGGGGGGLSRLPGSRGDLLPLLPAAGSTVDFPGCSAEVHTVYFDNGPLELYHGRLYLRPNARTLKARWIGRGGGEAGGAGGCEGGEGPGGGAAWVPRHVVVERKIYREGWKGKAGARKQGPLFRGA
jgi:hypothetical protein